MGPCWRKTKVAKPFGTGGFTDSGLPNGEPFVQRLMVEHVIRNANHSPFGSFLYLICYEKCNFLKVDKVQKFFKKFHLSIMADVMDSISVIFQALLYFFELKFKLCIDKCKP
jgi:hypothetical protein